MTNHPVEATRPSSRNAGVEVKPRSEQVYAMILDDRANAEPSCIERCLYHCSPKKRAPSGIADVPEIANLSSVLFQDGDHSTANTAMTLKWAVFDKEKRVADLKAYGGFGGEVSLSVLGLQRKVQHGSA